MPNMTKALNRNDPCRCGSGKKYKHCCQDKDSSKWMSKTAMTIIAIVILAGLVLGGISFIGGDSQSACPAGTTWSEAHQHCH